MYANKMLQLKIDLFWPYIYVHLENLISNHVIYMKSIWFYLICFYSKILENFEENRLLSEKLFSLVVQFFVSPPMGRIRTLGNCSSHFSEILYEVMVQKVRKNFPRAFMIICQGQNWPKFGLSLAYVPDARGFDFFVDVWKNVKLIFWSLDEVVWDLRNHVRPFVCQSGTQFLENCSLLFSETLQIVRACKFDKNVPSSFFEKNFRFAHFGQELSKIDHFDPKCMPKNRQSQSVH